MVILSSAPRDTLFLSHPIMNDLATDNLADLIRKKHQILVQLREIGRRQEKLAEEAATTALLQLLGAKQHLIAALQMVERSLRPFQAEDPDQRIWRSPADRADCAQRATECQQLLREIMDLERSQEARMIERRDQVAAQLKRAGAAHEAVGAYARHRRPQQPYTAASTETLETRLDLTSETS